ncbi:cupin domain-containing protein [Sphingomonas solaris]|uniref:DUF861 domain-containing protein n=1 Tax=Alterirhizorhabdus solaris TaxID=2529389 RepID=A0A558QT88_9SPHN|nr:cupin domain-containing protein [Sphingomonas solaris]TVV70366.1 DUF861 domain-containing protein [Sphingomonas solaris]
MSDVAETVRSFVDLRAFAADAGPVPAGDWLSARVALPLPGGPVTLDLLALDGGAGTADPLPGDEFVLVIAGALAIQHDGGAISLGQNESGVLPGGGGFRWTAAPATRAIVMRCTSGPAGAEAPLIVDEAAPLAPSGAPLADLLVGPTPACRSVTDYRSANGEFMVGTWDSTPYHRLPMRYRHYELMHLLQGAVTFVDEAGRAGTFATGDIFLIEQGAMCSWDSREQVKKVYAIYRPAA